MLPSPTLTFDLRGCRSFTHGLMLIMRKSKGFLAAVLLEMNGAMLEWRTWPPGPGLDLLWPPSRLISIEGRRGRAGGPFVVQM